MKIKTIEELLNHPDFKIINGVVRHADGSGISMENLGRGVFIIERNGNRLRVNVAETNRCGTVHEDFFREVNNET